MGLHIHLDLKDSVTARTRGIPRGLRHSLAHQAVQEAMVGHFCRLADYLRQIGDVDTLDCILLDLVLLFGLFEGGGGKFLSSSTPALRVDF